ncbi:MAG: efflux RND transporter permease subunit [Oscillospiraceae bacterium]|nr:efflux RND transporter permease subunit [Oscillospiraceae bacterium]
MPKFSVQKPLTVFVAAVAVVILGIVAYLRMTPDLLPNMDFPYAVIITTDPGASPEAVEAKISRPMEQAMATLDHIESVSSTSQNSVSMVVLQFEDGTNMDTVGVDIQQNISLLQSQWDDTVGAPYVLKINPSVLPVEVTAVSYTGYDIHALSAFVTDTLTPKLEGISGVASVSVSGSVVTQAHVILDQDKLDALRVTLTEAVNRQLDASAQELRNARLQVENAQKALKGAQQNAIGGAVENALKTVQEGLQNLQAQKTALEKRLEQIRSLSVRLTEVNAERLRVRSQIAIWEVADSLTATQTEDLLRLRDQEETLTSEAQAIDAQLRALGTDAESVENAMEELRQSIRRLNEAMDTLRQDETVEDLSRQVTSGVVSGLDALGQLTSGTVQIQQALSQIDQGLSAIESYRQQTEGQTDLSGMLTISTLSALLTAQNFSMPAGYVQDNEGISYMVSVGDAFDSRSQLDDLLLFDPGIEGVEPIYLHTVADVVVTDNSDEVYAKINGENGISLMFTKQSNYATAAVSRNIADRFEELEAEYDGLHFEPLVDQGDYIYLIVKTILSSLLWGALFSVLVLFLFLRDWRPTLITLLSIPISVIFAVVLMYFTGVTVNMISLSGLAVSVGMLVDNSVVVIENIYRLRAKGATVIQSAVSGAQQVLGAIVASTLTTVCVFLPIVFVEGLTKQLFTDLALTMTYSLLASLLVALTLVPAMACGMLRRERDVRNGLLDKIYPAYRRALGWTLSHKAVVLVLALLLLVGSAWGAVSRGFSFMPEIDMNNVSVTVAMPDGTTFSQARELADEVVARAMTMDHVETVGAVINNSGGSMQRLRMMRSSDGGDYDVSIYITLPEGYSGMDAGRRLASLCQDLPCQVKASTVMSFDMLTGNGITVNLYGSDMEDLQSAARTVANAIGQVEGVEQVSDGLEESVPALHIIVDRTAAMQKGMTVAQIYLQIAAALTDSTAGMDMTLDGVGMDLVIESAEGSRLQRETLLDLEIQPSSSAIASVGSMTDMGALTGMSGMGMPSLSSGANLPDLSLSAGGDQDSFRLGEVATVEETVSLGTIQRQQQRRYVSVTVEVADGYNVTHVADAVQRTAADLPLPDGVSAVFSGEREAIMDSMEQLVQMLVLGMLLVYFVMVAQFQSLKSPFIVMFTIPLAFTGGFLALLIAGVEVSVISLIGFVMLVGIIVNNGIVLVDYINRQRLSGMARREAIIEAGVTRMRPILMTSLTTILGLIVMALAHNAGTALMQPVALVCIGGLLYATLMTLFVIPCIYDIMNKKELRRVDEAELKTLDI